VLLLSKDDSITKKSHMN